MTDIRKSTASNAESQAIETGLIKKAQKTAQQLQTISSRYQSSSTRR
jgi:hypothetical protein